jgi:hypothetical protein
MLKAKLNPFASDRVLSRVRYLPQAVSWDELIARLERLRFRASIVGPEGSGKTTLLEDLSVRYAGTYHVRWISVSPDSSQIPFRSLSGFSKEDLVFVDGADHMPRLRWKYLAWSSANAGGLIVTSHRYGLLPALIECSTNPQLLNSINSYLLGKDAAGIQHLAERLFFKHEGNLRNALRELYDIWAHSHRND